MSSLARILAISVATFVNLSVVLHPAQASPPTVSVDAHQSLDSKSRARFLDTDATQALQRELGSALTDAAGDRTVRLQVDVDEFRLRTKKQVAWGGLASGGDYIGAQVTIEGADGTERTIKATGVLVTGALGGSENKRLDKIIDGLIQDIVGEVR